MQRKINFCLQNVKKERVRVSSTSASPCVACPVPYHMNVYSLRHSFTDTRPPGCLTHVWNIESTPELAGTKGGGGNGIGLT